MIKSFQTLIKNFKVLFRNKYTFLVLLLAPLIVIFIMGLLFNNQNGYNVNVGYSLEDNSSLSADYIEFLKEKGFELADFSSKQNCLQALENNWVHVCLIFPKNFEIKNGNESSTLEIYSDVSRRRGDKILNEFVISSIEEMSGSFQMNNTQKLVSVVNNNHKILLDQKQYTMNLDKLTKDLFNIRVQLSTNIKRLKSLSNSNYNTKDLEEQVSTTRKDLIANINNITFYLNEAENSIENISDKIGDANLTSSEATSIKSDITKVEDRINEAELKISIIKKTDNLDDVEDIIDDLGDDINSLTDSLNSIITKITELSSDIIKISTDLNKVSTNLNNSNYLMLKNYDSIQVKNSKNIVNPVNLEVKDLNGTKTHLSLIVPNLIVSLCLIISIMLASNLILIEKRSNAYFRNFLSKASSFDFVFGHFLTLFIIVFCQIFLIVFFYYIFFLQNIISFNFLILLCFIILIVSLFVLIGMLIGYLSKNEGTSFILAFLFVFFLFMFSGFLLPLEVLSNQIIKLTSYNPYFLSEFVIKKVIFFDSNFFELKYHLLILFCYVIVLFFINLFLESVVKKGFVYQLFSRFELYIRMRLDHNKKQEKVKEDKVDKKLKTLKEKKK